ncbi:MULTISPECIES: calcium/sodium antiporter [Thalassolituus]|uniref:calcium/sodium antiporter n=3 Tax=Oceanospirillaceae TaxID=135620 RepID=UPI0007D00D75|nr:MULTISPECIES: calcium/sodium antiporter [Thalassolituus]KZZ06555.1 calcium:proton antiporter [Oleibacter sp. HI0075]MAX88001.1 calcium/sodium antiporter [Oceanospirillaceae bacterium]MEE3159558.1 calcium/sodium antiporter [Pseudomonadota bacterium]HCG79185.1 calcium/sodium antiporter [Oceanospirillales bacterium]MEE3209026.1 calcium/sodium antiporter [Pseudomonadota bacterium]|tara:strand:- start:7066 stop:8028 length:963 start_codon:yes stop_codon:yes gene_type:complete
MYPEIGAILVGLIFLVWSADKFVIGAAATARHLGMSQMLVGLTIVSIGTSAPEMFVSAMASIDGAGNLAIGNAIGSNITNIALVLGITALVAPIPLQKGLLKKELPLLMMITLLAGVVLIDLELNLVDALILIAALIFALFLMFQQSSDSGESVIDEDEAAEIESTPTSKAVFWLIVGLITLMASSKALVWGATGIATAFGVSDLVIGLTIVAIGTSLPELAASVASALKGHHDIAIGNVIGSNIFNLLAVMPIPGILAVTAVEPMALYRDYIVMAGVTFALLLFFIICYRRGTLGRIPGIILTAGYLGYMFTLFLANQA